MRPTFYDQYYSVVPLYVGGGHQDSILAFPGDTLIGVLNARND